MISGVVTNRYAQGLFLVSEEHGVTNAVDEGLQLLAGTFAEYPEFKSIIEHPVISTEDKLKSIDKVFGDNLDGLVKRFLHVLFGRGRSAYVTAVAERFHQLTDEAQGKRTVVVETAKPLADGEAAKLDAELSKAWGKEIHAEVEVNSELLGGYRIRVGNRVLDATVQGALTQFTEQLLAGAVKR
ncbi:ATP synthase F1 subunit delta [Alicyclobacillus sp. SO9]|uniref:ATP synthase F1 subunit delta n=1 Tax=Alicyclobacillus sp. SO9 TaxID=2665646 RepID=UPI0018E73400|nr:ATP synthase F1 subunit delta [Alicyclobacillus sp. SO9]QQE78778.1 ATP synthase F1 subunit delta [Alicyclobacillus sp. SO9]